MLDLLYTDEEKSGLGFDLPSRDEIENSIIEVLPLILGANSLEGGDPESAVCGACNIASVTVEPGTCCFQL